MSELLPIALGVGLLGAAILLMVDVARQPKPCPECDHCRREAHDRADARRMLKHLEAHYTREGMDDCRDSDCPGRR